MSLLRALHAELIKLKRTLAFRMVFIGPLLVALLQFFITWNQRRSGDGTKLWEDLSQNGFAVWAIFLLPLLMTLETALLNGIEHGEKLWKHLLALPIPRHAVYTAKLLVAVLLALFSTIVLSLLLVLSGYLLMVVKPELANAGVPPLTWLWQSTLKVWVASWLIIALHHWISIRWSSFTIALGAGVAGTFFAMFTATSKIGKYYPWLLPVGSLNVIPGGDRVSVALWLGGLGGVIAAVLGCIEFVRRDVGEGDTAVSRRLLLSAAAAAIGFGVLGTYLQRPQPTTIAASANPQAARIESGLLSAVVLKGQHQRLTLADRMTHYDVPGVSIAVIDDGKIEWARGYGLLEEGSNQRVTTETLFQAASISKPVTAVAALAMVQQGRLLLDEDVNLKLKSWHVPENERTRDAKVTLRRLLSHTAGIVEHKYPGYQSDAALPTAMQVLDGLKPAETAPIRVERVPGSAFQYSGGGYMIVQQLLSDVAGKPFPDLMKEMIFSSVGMSHSTFAQPLPRALERSAASGHERDGTVIKGRWHLHPEMAAAGLWTTPSDLAQLAIALWQSYKGQAGKALSPEIARQMMTRQHDQYGLGLVLGGKDKLISFSHDGSNIGYKCALVMFLETGQGAVVMTNGEHGGNLFGEILRGMAAEYNWPGYRPVVREPVPIETATLAAYVGEYEIDEQAGQAKIVASVDNGKLVLRVPAMGGQRMELYPLGQDRFFMLEENAEFRFIKNERGAVTSLQATTPNENVTAKKRS